MERLLTEQNIAAPEAGAKAIMNTFTSLNVHPDVVQGIEALSEVADLVTLSNGAVSVAQTLLDAAGIRGHFTALLSVQDAPAWKPDRSAYEYAAAKCDTETSRMLLVAVHPWDLHGAHRAGMRTAWINRDGQAYPVYFIAPDVQVPDLPSLVDRLRPT